MPSDPSGAVLPAIFVTSFLVGLSGALVPGPLFAVVIVESARQGFWAGPRLVLGHAILELGMVVVLALWLDWFVQQTSLAFLIGIPGGIFLVWMAWRVYKDTPMAAATLERSLGSGGAASPMRELGGLMRIGAAVSVLNPYWFIWWATVGAGYVVGALEAAAIGLAAFYLGHILADFAWYGAVGAAVSGSRQIMSPRFYRATLRGTAVFLGFLGVAFVYLGVTTAFSGGV